MIYTLKFEGKKYVYDTTSGFTVAFPALPFKMVEALEPPLESICPTALRYELAKYDFSDVEDAYNMILEYAKNGILYKEDDGVIRMTTDGEFACKNERLATELLTKAFSGFRSEIRFEAMGTDATRLFQLANGIAQDLGKMIL